MQIIVRGNANIQSLLKTRKKGVSYKPSLLLLAQKVEEGLLLHNTITGEMVLLSEKEKAAFENLPSIETPDISELIDRGFIIPENCDEIKRTEQLRTIFLKKT